jgi:hypothetical protein
MAKSAFLRVYLPAEQVGYHPEYVRVADGGRVLRRSAFGVWGEEPRNDAFITTYDGRRYVCPRHPRLRMLEGIVAFRAAYPGLTASLLVPEDMASDAMRELERIRTAGPVRSHILTSPWHVPLRWFAAFTPGERELLDVEGGGVSIRYRTLQGDALRRLRRVLDVLGEAGFEDYVVDQVGDVIDWLDGFPAEALVELDYDEVASLFADGDLVFDDTAADIAAVVEALESGDLEAAGEAYATAATRWSHAQAIAHAN